MVAAGNNPDFIVLDKNPLENTANSRKINKVYVQGQEVDRAGLKASGPRHKKSSFFVQIRLPLL